MKVKKRGINDRERAVVQTMVERLTRKQALERLKEYGFEMSDSTYGRIKAELKKSQYDRLTFIAGFGFERQHLERLDSVEYILKLQWELFHQEDRPFAKSMILKEIRELQPLISAYYDATRSVMKQRRDKQPDNKSDKIPEPEPGLSLS